MSSALAVSDAAAPTIESLAERAQAGEADCFDEIVRRIRPRLRGFLNSRVACAEDAEDLVQETLVKALANLERYDSRYRFSTWLFTIAANLARSHHRSRRAHLQAVDVAAGDVDPSATLDAHARGTRLWQRAHSVLPPAHYTALWLRYGEDLTVREIAARTGKTAVHVRVMLYRARRRLAVEVQ